MRKSHYNKIIALAVILTMWTVTALHAQEKTRLITKSYDIRKDTRIEVSNKFGDVIIKTWDKGSVEIRVEIEARGRNEAKTQRILDAIDINFNDRISNGYLSVKTDVGNTGNNASFSINYEISMPDGNSMVLQNSFGNVYMDDYRGDLQLKLKYGQLVAGALSDGDISVSFSPSRCEIDALLAGELDLGYSKMTIDAVGDIKITSRFSDLEIEKGGDISLEARYGDLEIASLKSLEGELQFAGLEIGYLSERLEVEARYGDGIKIEKISKNFKEIDIENSFSSVRLNLPAGIKTTLAFDLQFGSLKLDGEEVTFTKVVKETNSSEYRGYIGSAQATSSIKVETKYGNIRLETE